MVDRGRAVWCFALRPERRTAGIDVDDAEATRLRAGEPGTGIAEIRPVHGLEANHFRPEIHGGAEVRYGNDGWVQNEIDGLDQTLVLPSLNISVPFAEIYDGVTFEAPKEQP